jgi:CHAD domain-containing protein
VKQPAALWKKRARLVEEACQSVRRGSADALHDLRVALRRVAVTAETYGRSREARGARRIARSLSAARQLEVDRRLLEGVSRLGLLSSDAITALGARWEKLGARGSRRLTRAAEGRRMERLRRRLERLARKGTGTGVKRLSAEREAAGQALSRPPDGRDDKALHRYRKAVKRARYLAEDFEPLGLPEPPGLERERALQELLGRWNDLLGFRKRLTASREEAEQRGTVILAGELARLLAALDRAIEGARAAALAQSRRGTRVVPIRPGVRVRA